MADAQAAAAGGAAAATVRPAVRGDAAVILRFIIELAEFEKEADQVQMTEAVLARDGWPTAEEAAAGHTQPRFHCLLAELPSGEPCGFALYFHNYSTWEGLGIYLEDLYVSPVARGGGVGTMLIKAVAQAAVEKGCARLQWQVIDFNTVESEGCKWMNMIMDREALAKFTASL